MAFRQPTFHAPQRVYIAPQEQQTQTPAPQTQQRNIADSQEWILFSPTAAASTTGHGYRTSTSRTRTAGHSRISDFGSLDTAARSYDYEEGSEEPIDEEDGELDSLDSHLHEFRAEPSVYREEGGEISGTVVPTHDGLGSFRLDQTTMGEDVQEHLYAFERYNPRRVKRRRESIEIGIIEEGERAAEADRTRRIEMWRMEQSRLLADEIQKETRRREQSMSSEKRAVLEDTDEDAATLGHVDETPDEEGDSFWNRITKRVIRDLMGIDDDLLAIIFGESLPGDEDLSTTPPASQSIIQTKKYDESTWEHRLLERVAQELGILVSQLSEHPGAFSTYLYSQQIPLPYAGLPVIPESRDHALEASTQTAQTAPQFNPTIQTQAPTTPIPTTSLATALKLQDEDATPRAENALNSGPTLTREEWERDLDIKMVFHYLRSRFTSKFKSQPNVAFTSLELPTSGTSHLASASTADSAAQAARVRQHHPLVTRQKSSGERRRSIERRTWRATVPGASPGASGAGGGMGMGLRRGSSSCASERLSFNGHVRNSGSSRHYWDFGGQSVGSGSLIASTGGMGSWGEV